MNLLQINGYIFSTNLRRYARQVVDSYILGECLIEVLEEEPFYGFCSPPSRFNQDCDYTTISLSVNSFKGKLAIQELSKSELVNESQMNEWLSHDEGLDPDKQFKIPSNELDIIVHYSAQYKLFTSMRAKLRDIIDKSNTGFVDNSESKKAILDEPIVQVDISSWQLQPYTSSPSLSDEDVKILLKDNMLIGDSFTYHVTENAYSVFMERRYKNMV